MKTTIIKCIAAIILAAIALLIGYNMGKSHTYKASDNYYYKTEALLDSINNWDSSFMDTVMETDVYYEYELSCIQLNGYH